MPLARYAMYKKGVEMCDLTPKTSIYCQLMNSTSSYTAPTADGRPTWLPAMQHIAQEGRVFVISANQFQKREDFPAAYPPIVERAEKNMDAGDEPWTRGGSCIVDPLGNVLAGPLWDEEGLIYADVSLSL